MATEFKLVPVEPTEEMVIEALSVISAGSKLASPYEIYRRMVAAAPKPDAEPVYQVRQPDTEEGWVDVDHNGYRVGLAMKSMEARVLYAAQQPAVAVQEQPAPVPTDALYAMLDAITTELDRKSAPGAWLIIANNAGCAFIDALTRPQSPEAGHG